LNGKGNLIQAWWKNANGNHNWVDWIGRYLVDNSVSDFSRWDEIQDKGNSPKLKDVDPFPGSEQIIQNQLDDELLRFALYNKISLRGRISNNSLHHLNNLEESCEALIELIDDQLPKD